MSSIRPLTSEGDATLLAHYAHLVAGGHINDDAAQRAVLTQLQALQEQLIQVSPAGGLLSRLFKAPAAPMRGLYIWGNVGRGKSMLMDWFFDSAPVAKKRRVHFHAFMQEVHARIHQLRQHGTRSSDGSDPVVMLARELAQEARLLCFDELQATDVADATLLYRLFQGIFAAGVLVVGTSNHPPASLYTGNVQRERFAKFIALIEEHMAVTALSSPEDYRYHQKKSLRQVYFTPLGTGADAFIADTLEQVCVDMRPHNAMLSVQGRAIPYCAYDHKIGRFTFHDLCETPLGPADYLSIAQSLETVILTGIPALPPEKRNEAKRFVTLIDALYEAKTILICTAGVLPEQLYIEGDGAFEFQRTISRLVEMQSANYLQRKQHRN